jgi:hypothetical protein
MILSPEMRPFAKFRVVGKKSRESNSANELPKSMPEVFSMRIIQ